MVYATNNAKQIFNPNEMIMKNNVLNIYSLQHNFRNLSEIKAVNFE